MPQILADVAPDPSVLAPWLIGCLVCVVLVAAAVVILVIVLVKRSNKRKQGGGSPGGPGQYQPPQN